MRFAPSYLKMSHEFVPASLIRSPRTHSRQQKPLNGLIFSSLRKMTPNMGGTRTLLVGAKMVLLEPPERALTTFWPSGVLEIEPSAPENEVRFIELSWFIKALTPTAATLEVRMAIVAPNIVCKRISVVNGQGCKVERLLKGVWKYRGSREGRMPWIYRLTAMLFPKIKTTMTFEPILSSTSV